MYTKFIFLAIVASIIVSCSSNTTTSQSPGQEVFIANCSVCHGVDGKLGVGNAKDLSISTIDPNLCRAIISSGKGNMPSFKQILTPEQIEQVITYINTLRK